MWKRNEDEEENEENIATLSNVNNNICLPVKLADGRMSIKKGKNSST